MSVKLHRWLPPLERFNRNTIKDLSGGCWDWHGNRTPQGYGQFGVDGKKVYTHKWAYEHFIGPIPEGKQLDHTCRNRRCCNPKHLEPVTVRTNILRGEGIAANNARKNACKRGHPFNNENTYITPAGARVCRICRYNTKKRFKERTT